MGSQDDLKLLLMKAVNRKNPETGRYTITQNALSFLGRRYVSPGLLQRLRGKEIDIYYDRRDISVIYLVLEGELVGEALCTEFMGRRVSVWEANAQRRADASQKQEANRVSLESRQHIQEQATAGRRALSQERKRLEQQRLLDQQRTDIHPSHVQDTLQAFSQASPPPSPQRSTLLSPAIPEEDTVQAPRVRLAVRTLEEHHD